MGLAFVTGGTGGVGKAICAALADEGNKVIALDLHPYLKDLPFTFQKIDISKPDQVNEILARYDAPDILVNCAGITRDRVCWKMSDEDWQAVLDVNLTGPFNMVRTIAPSLKQRGSGTIINISSINATRGKFGQSNYVATKAALEALTRNWAIELGKYAVRVNAVAPGFVWTDMTEKLPEEVRERALSEYLLPKGPKPEDIANAVCFLCSDKARSITGQVLHVDSGQLLGS